MKASATSAPRRTAVGGVGYTVQEDSPHWIRSKVETRNLGQFVLLLRLEDRITSPQQA
jgi:hypothetical protein